MPLTTRSVSSELERMSTRHVGVLQLDLSGQIQAVLEVIDVEEHDLGVKAPEEGQPLGGGPGLQRGVVRLHHGPDERRPALRASVDDQDRSRGS